MSQNFLLASLSCNKKRKMLKVVKAKKHQLKGKIDKGSKFHHNSGHPVQKSMAIHFHPCSPVLLPQNTCPILVCGIFLSNLLVYLVASGNTLWKLEDRNFYDQP